MKSYYNHRFIDGSPVPYTLSKIVCVGLNYRLHIQEMKSETPIDPVLFIKSSMCAVPMSPQIAIPTHHGAVHYEAEVALLIGAPLKNATPEDCLDAVIGVGLGLDLTLREVQSRLKEKGLPWEISKGFDGSCPLSPFLPIEEIDDINDLAFYLTKNGMLVQQGNTGDMITLIPKLLSFMSQYFTLLPGDVIMTGTPAGVGPLMPEDHLVLSLNNQLEESTRVIAEHEAS